MKKRKIILIPLALISVWIIASFGYVIFWRAIHDFRIIHQQDVLRANILQMLDHVDSVTLYSVVGIPHRNYTPDELDGSKIVNYQELSPDDVTKIASEIKISLLAGKNKLANSGFDDWCGAQFVLRVKSENTIFDLLPCNHYKTMQVYQAGRLINNVKFEGGAFQKLGSYLTNVKTPNLKPEISVKIPQ